MLVNLYRSKTPIAVFSLPMLIGILGLHIFLKDYPADAHFWNWQNRLDQLVQENVVVHYLVAVLLISFIAHQINTIFNRQSFYSKTSFLPGFIYVLCLFGLDQLHFSPELIAHLFLVWALGQFLRLRRQEGAKTIMFWGGFLLGLAMIFSTLSAGLILLSWICLMIFRPFVWREWLLVILGFVLPIFYYFAILFMVKGTFYFDVADPIFQEEIDTDLFSALALGIFGLIVLGGLYKYLSVMRTEIIRFKKQSLVLFHFLWIAFGIWSLGYFVFDLTYTSFVIPLAYLIGTAFLHAKSSATPSLVVIIWLIISGANIFLIR